MVIQYKCSNCGADMIYDSTIGLLHCESCGNNETVEDAAKTHEEPAKEDTKSHTTLFNESESKEYHCNNCGAILITDKDTTATTCSFCGAGVVLSDRLSGVMAPGKIIPFTINKEEAQVAFRNWCKKGLLTPKGFMTAERIKSITGLYVPFWLYDLNGKGHADATCTKVRTYTRGDYRYTETSHFHVQRSVNLNYMKVPVDASEKMNDELMNQLEPYHYKDLKDFDLPFLAGFLAEKYNYNSEELFPRVKGRITDYVDHYLSSSINQYTTTIYNQKNIQVTQQNAEYALFPVWMVCYDYNKSEHTFAMNGQTGKIVGNPPLCKKKMAAWFGGISGISFVLLKIIALMSGGFF